MKLRIGYDGEKYWVEQLRWYGFWKKCPFRFGWDKLLRWEGNVRQFDTYEEAYIFSCDWQRHYAKKHNNAVYTNVGSNAI